MLSGDEISRSRNLRLRGTFQRCQGAVIYMTLTNNLRGKVAPGLQFVVGHKRRDFFFARTRRRTDFRRNPAFFHALYQRFGEGVRIITDIVSKMSPYIAHVIGPDFPAVLQMDNVGGRYRCESGNREEENDTARTHNS